MSCTFALPVVFERPCWRPGDRRKIYGSGRTVDIMAGMYFDEDYGFGTYYAADGQTYLCNEAMARDLADSSGIQYVWVDAGKCSGGVYQTDYRYMPGVFS